MGRRRTRELRRPARESGMVTAETAIVLPVLLLVLAGAVAAVTVVGAQLRCVDAAREGARAAARGEPGAVVTQLSRGAAPEGAVTTVTTDGEQIQVTVSARITPLGPVPLRITVTSQAVALREPGGQTG
jgi:Flp pilus assembly protein TadG